MIERRFGALALAEVNIHDGIDIIIKTNRAKENARLKIYSTFEEVRKRNNEIVRLFYTDQMMKLKSLENKIVQIQENIASA